MYITRRPLSSILDWIRWVRCRLRGPGTCDLRFTLQGRYVSVLDLTTLGIKNTAVTIHGSALLAGKGVTEKDFIGVKDEATISAALSSYLDKNPVTPNRNDLIILDMEPRYPDPNHPNEWIHFSPKDLANYKDLPPLPDTSNPKPLPIEKNMQDQLIKGYILRTRVARQVLLKKWPTVKLGLYGVIVPMGKGQENDSFLKRMEAHKRAGELGMYDFVDYLVPVLYNGFGPSDVPLANGDFDKTKLHNWIERATHQAITNTQQLTRSTKDTIPLAPILTFWVHNGNSTDDNKVILPETMEFQLRLLQKYCSVQIILLWSGSETMEEMKKTEFERVDIKDFLNEVHGLPPPGCESAFVVS